MLIAYDITVHSGDDQAERAYKHLLRDQLQWCNDNRETITGKAEKLYHIVTETPGKMRSLTKRCCNFKRLESILDSRQHS